MVFVQNYVNGWGYAYAASWSLAVEEHFYFLLAIGLSYGINKKKVILKEKAGAVRLETIIVAIMIACFMMRIAQNYFFPDLNVKNITMTHLRIDSLLAGVLVSYWYHFRGDDMKVLFEKTKLLILPLILALISFTPFFDYINSPFERTIGFSLLYIAFSLLLIYFLLTENINEKLNAVFTKYIVNAISKIGVYSYSIYIIHSVMVNYLGKVVDSKVISFLIVFCLSVLSGKLMTDLIENYFLKIRDRYYPKRLT
jgi:peptidoglycan/LPS O-acetylase OafA/YrhL